MDASWADHTVAAPTASAPRWLPPAEPDATSPRPRDSRAPPATEPPPQPTGTAAPSSSSASSAASGSTGGSPSMILLAELGLIGCALFKLLISPARWRSLTFTSLRERPG